MPYSAAQLTGNVSAERGTTAEVSVEEVIDVIKEDEEAQLAVTAWNV
jgi:hypothetical protein